jgi:hypothetical protein
LPMDACVRVDACRVLHNYDIAKGSWVDADGGPAQGLQV